MTQNVISDIINIMWSPDCEDGPDITANRRQQLFHALLEVEVVRNHYGLEKCEQGFRVKDLDRVKSFPETVKECLRQFLREYGKSAQSSHAKCTTETTKVHEHFTSERIVMSERTRHDLDALYAKIASLPVKPLRFLN